MPTGYTAVVGDGKITTLREFALICARGMGACIMMRDEPWDAPIPERFEPQTKYHDDKLEEAKAVLETLPKLSEAECESRAVEEYKSTMASDAKYRAERELRNSRYRSMLDAVSSWHTDAEGIKEFMVEQLNISIERDYPSKSPVKLTGAEWREDRLKQAHHDVAYHERARGEEIWRTQERNRWLSDLRSSLPTKGNQS
ncbi:hypothetical protein BFS86_19705 [Shewanella algae]|nr:hypothetical protein BFS86_19705 [Shewanella algae]